MVCQALLLFFTVPPKRHDFRKNVTEHKMCVLIFCTNTSEIFLFPGRNEEDVINVHRSSCKVIVINVGMLMKLEFFGHIFKKFSNTKFHENPSSGCRIVPCGQTDLQIEEANRCRHFLCCLIQLFSTHDDWGIFSSYTECQNSTREVCTTAHLAWLNEN